MVGLTVICLGLFVHLVISVVLYRLQMVYGGRIRAHSGTSVDTYCDLNSTELVHQVTVYATRNRNNYYVVGGVELVTTYKTCGPYGVVTQDNVTFSGYQLMYASGAYGHMFDRLRLHFEC